MNKYFISIYKLLESNQDCSSQLDELEKMKLNSKEIKSFISLNLRYFIKNNIMAYYNTTQYNMTDFAMYNSKMGKRQNVVILEPTQSRLIDNLQGAHSAVFFNSSASVAAVCEGIPVFADDSSCVAWSVANKDVSKIELPDVFSREQWIYDLAAAHWSDADARAGRIYQKFLPYLK